MPWPTNEYEIPHLATMAFPTLFPDGKSDPTNLALLRDVPLQERVEHRNMLKLLMVNGYTVLLTTLDFSIQLSMIQRKQILQQSRIFLKQNPGEAHLTVDELHEMVATNNSTTLMSKVSRYVGNMAGTNSYWNKVREELKTIITNVGAPNCFLHFRQLICIGLNYMLCLVQILKLVSSQ